MDVGHRLLLERMEGMATVRVIRQHPFLRVRVSAPMADVHSRQKWLQDLLDTAPDGFTWVIPRGGFDDYVFELWRNDVFEL